jgi:hypothetical protein
MADGVQRISGTQLETLLRARGIELGDRRLRQLAKEGFFPEPDRGEYEFLATLLGLVRYYRELSARRSDEFEAEEQRKLTESADEIAIRNEKSRGHLVEVEAVYQQNERTFIALKARILASNLTDLEKDEILHDLVALTVRSVAEPAEPAENLPPPGRPPETTAAA